MTKTDKVLNYLKSGKTLTSWDAIQLFRVTRLASLINRFKSRGYQIETEIKVNNGNTYAEYRMNNVIQKNSYKSKLIL